MDEDTTPQEPVQDFDVAKLRELALNEPRKITDLATPFWPGTNGQIGLIDIGTDELMSLESLRKNAKNPSTYLAAIICKALVKKATGETMFQDADRDMVAAMGASVTTPIFKAVQAFFGLGDDALANAKKNS